MLTSCPYLSCKWPCRDTRGDMGNPERREQSQQIPQEPAILCQPCGSSTDTTITPREQRQKVISGSASPSLFLSTHLQSPWEAQTPALPHSPTGPPSPGCCCGTSGSPGGPGNRKGRDVAQWDWHGRAPACLP